MDAVSDYLCLVRWSQKFEVLCIHHHVTGGTGRDAATRILHVASQVLVGENGFAIVMVMVIADTEGRGELRVWKYMGHGAHSSGQQQ